RIEGCSHRVETSDTQQNLVGHLAVTGFDDAQTVEMSIEPGSDLCDLLWIGNPTGFEQDVFDGLWACEQSDHRLDEVVANLAADAAVGQADYTIVHAYDEFGVDIDGAKVVDEDSHAQAMI